MDNPGPEFWQRVYGISDIDEFRDRVGPYLPDVHWFGIGPSEETVLLLAWEDPLSAPGSVAAITLSIQGLAGTDAGSVHQAVRNVAPRVQLEQELAMSQLIIPNVYRCAIQATSGGQEVVNVIGVRGSSSGQEVAAAAAVKTAWEAASGPLSKLGPGLVMAGYYVTDLSSGSGGIANLTSASVGPATGSLATAGACALVKWNGGTRNRSSRGRLYFGPMNEANINADGRTLASAAITSVQNAFSTFRSSLTGSGFTLCVISRTTNTAYDVSSHSVETTIATQRRRIRS